MKATRRDDMGCVRGKRTSFEHPWGDHQGSSLAATRPMVRRGTRPGEEAQERGPASLDPARRELRPGNALVGDLDEANERGPEGRVVAAAPPLAGSESAGTPAFVPVHVAEHAERNVRGVLAP